VSAGRGRRARGHATSTELARVAALAERFAAPPDASIERAIGDDAAVLRPAARADATRLVWTIDAQVEGVHFRSDLATWRDVGWRSFMAAASDLAAMGAAPWCALSSLVLPRTFGDEALDELAAGQAEAAGVVGAPIVGGNLSRGREFSASTTLLGAAAGRVLERTARTGDGIWVSGPIGAAAAGLAWLERGFDASLPEAAACVLAWRRPRARIDEGLRLAAASSTHGAIDVSDGLARDVAHLARGAGLRAVLSAPQILAHVEPALGAVAVRLGASPLDLALYGGEDYALVAASAAPIDGLVHVGRFEAGEGVALEGAGGVVSAIDPGGFDHFA
jgi:thiamine-monophosphate kinase